MLRRSIVGLACAVALAFAATAQAQENATLTLRSGERFTGQLVDLGGIGLTFRYGGTDRQFPPGDVAVIEFEGAPAYTLTADQLRELNNGQHVIVFRDGRVIVGHFADVGERHPLRITIQTPSGTTNYHSNEIWRIYMAPPPASAQGSTPAGGASAQPSVPGAIVVSSTQQWTPTGITVRRGERVTFNSTGEIVLSPDPNDKAQPTGAFSQRKAPGSPLPDILAGALIGRIGNGQPFAIGDQTAIPMPASGPLYLGINDDVLGDNSGQFNVVVTRPRR
jgi:hypothetical protein